MFKYGSLFSLLLVSLITLAQEGSPSKTYPLTDFRYPLDLPPAITGSFGELRANHFHSGLDFRTNQREGYPVYAVADGYISRLRVQNGGFGQAIYMNHLNGYTTVYAHLQRFNQRILSIVRAYQYRKESFEIDFPLLPVEIPVKKGEIIGWSGNTGSSGGPHLHFEIRDTQTEETINPQLFGITIPDKVKPSITSLYLYRLGNAPFSEATVKQYFQVTGSNGKYVVNQSPVISVNGNTGFGIQSIDRNSASENPVGVYSIELQLDGKPIYTATWERFSFDQSRAINSHLDYPALKALGRRVQKSFIEPGNPLQIYSKLAERGVLNLQDSAIHQLKYIVTDVAGNTSELDFRVRHDPKLPAIASQKQAGIPFRFDKENSYLTQNVRITLPKGVLYSDIDFRYKEQARLAGAWSAGHVLHTASIPLHSNYQLWIKPLPEMPEHLRTKAVIVSTSGASQGGVYEEGFIKAQPRDFGTFYVTTDITPPVIRPVNLLSGKSMAGVSRAVFRISDNLSGIKFFRGTINGKWVLMEFDPKTATLWHTFDERTPAGKNTFNLVVTDMKDNTNTFTATFTR